MPTRFWIAFSSSCIWRLSFTGLLGWLLWAGVHILYLIDFRNRLLVITQWAWAYVTFNKGARLITRNFQAEQRPMG